MPMIAPNRRPRARTTGAVALAIVAAILLGASVPRGDVLSAGVVAGSAVQDDLNAARARLADMLGTVQQVEGFVPQASVVAVVASLNLALDKLELASIALGGGFTAQATANITAANAIMDGLDAPIANLVAQADATKKMNALGIAVGAGAGCTAVAALIWLKRRHDKRQLQSFLAAEIDYAAGEKGDDHDGTLQDSPDAGDAASEA
jgi:hypothetical protein